MALRAGGSEADKLAQDTLMEHEMFGNHFRYVCTQVADELETIRLPHEVSRASVRQQRYSIRCPGCSDGFVAVKGAPADGATRRD